MRKAAQLSKQLNKLYFLFQLVATTEVQLQKYDVLYYLGVQQIGVC